MNKLGLDISLSLQRKIRNNSTAMATSRYNLTTNVYFSGHADAGFRLKLTKFKDIFQQIDPNEKNFILFLLFQKQSIRN